MTLLLSAQKKTIKKGTKLKVGRYGDEFNVHRFRTLNEKAIWSVI
jgi:hypothetical protein